MKPLLLPLLLVGVLGGCSYPAGNYSSADYAAIADYSVLVAANQFRPVQTPLYIPPSPPIAYQPHWSVDPQYQVPQQLHQINTTVSSIDRALRRDSYRYGYHQLLK